MSAAGQENFKDYIQYKLCHKFSMFYILKFEVLTSDSKNNNKKEL